jgi:hypothetical protein
MYIYVEVHNFTCVPDVLMTYAASRLHWHSILQIILKYKKANNEYIYIHSMFDKGSIYSCFPSSKGGIHYNCLKT